jgi:hypothetical protein
MGEVEMCKNLFSAFALLFSIVPNVADAQTISLLCDGIMYTYTPRNVQGRVIIDLDNQSVSSPVGIFRIQGVADQLIAFNDPNRRTVFGHVDRSSGEMMIYWYQPQEPARLSAGEPPQLEKYADLRCAPSKRLF